MSQGRSSWDDYLSRWYDPNYNRFIEEVLRAMNEYDTTTKVNPDSITVSASSLSPNTITVSGTSIPSGYIATSTTTTPLVTTKTVYATPSDVLKVDIDTDKIKEVFGDVRPRKKDKGYVLVNKPHYEGRIKKITMYVPNKVMGVKINNKEYKQVVKEPDEFSMEFGVALALAKSMYGGDYTPEGVEMKAKDFLLRKSYLKEIKTAIRAYEYEKELEEKMKKREEEIKQIKLRRREKNKKRRERVKARKIAAIREQLKALES